MCHAFVWNLKNITYLVVCERAICVPIHILGAWRWRSLLRVSFHPMEAGAQTQVGLQAWRLVTLLSEPSARSPVHNLFLAFPFPVSFIGTPKLEAMSAALPSLVHTLSPHRCFSRRPGLLWCLRLWPGVSLLPQLGGSAWLPSGLFGTIAQNCLLFSLTWDPVPASPALLFLCGTSLFDI